MTQLGRSFQPIKVVDLELTTPLPSFENLSGYCALRALIRLHGRPLGSIQVGISRGRVEAAELGRLIRDRLGWPALRELLLHARAATPHAPWLDFDQVLAAVPQADGCDQPLVTVAVCTRDRTADVARCLDALCMLDYPQLELLVIDNAPTSSATAELVQANYPQVRYLVEPRPGLSWARNKAIAEATGEILAFTDDDVIVDSGWVQAIARAFVNDTQVMAVTGMVAPLELETEAQILFEYQGGFTRSYDRTRYQFRRSDSGFQGGGRFGAGANMAFRRAVFAQIGGFDPALGVGTAVQGAEDIEMFFRVLHAEFALVYEPAALVWHRHRRDYADLRRQLAANGTALAAYHLHCWLRHRDQRGKFAHLHLSWFWERHLKRLIESFTRPHRYPRDLVVAELWGYLTGMATLPRAQRAAAVLSDSRSSLRPS